LSPERADQIRHIVYPEAGAMLSRDAIIPTTPNLARFGGTAQGVTAAQFQGWQAVLDFLAMHLR
jgi:hypothetical protein